MAIKEGDKFPMDSTFQIKGDAGPAVSPTRSKGLNTVVFCFRTTPTSPCPSNRLKFSFMYLRSTHPSYRCRCCITSARRTRQVL